MMLRCSLSTLAWLAALYLCPAAAEEIVLHVATDGDDSFSGTAATPNAERSDGPFATLHRARDEIRRRKTQGSGAAFTVKVRGGTYYLPETFTLSQPDSGTAQAPTTYQAYEDEVPVLTGGKVAGRFESYEGNILKTDLAAQGLAGARFKQLFSGGRRQILARYPNFEPRNPYAGGWAYAAGEPIPMYRDIPDESRRLFTMKPADLRDWARPTEAEILVFPRYNWWNNQLPVAALDRDSREVHLAGSASYPIRPGDRYYIYNLFEELDAPGEWYHDRETDTLYFYPPEEGFPGHVIVPTLSRVVHAVGAAHVTLCGFTLECCEGNAVELADCSDVRVVGCVIRNAGGTGVHVAEGRRCGVLGNDIAEVGSHAVSLRGGNRDTLTPAEHYAENNYIHHTGVFYKQGVGIALAGVGCRASHNLVHDCPRFAVMYSGNDQVIEWNHFRHVNLETADTGATYSGGRDWISPRGSVIRYNYIHDVFGFGKEQGHSGPWITPHYCWGIYLDDNSAEVHVYGNIVVRALRGLLHFHCARDNTIENNIFVEGLLQQIEMNGWTDHSRFLDQMAPAYEKVADLPAWKKYPGLARGGPPKDAIPMGGNRIRRNIIYYTGPGANLYRYRAQATRFLDDFECDANLIWHAGQPLKIEGLGNDVPAEAQWKAWQAMGFDRNSIVADPRFVDASNDDYRLQPNSPAFQLGFEPIPVEKIGPYASADRASWPIEEAPGARELGFRRATMDLQQRE